MFGELSKGFRVHVNECNLPLNQYGITPSNSIKESPLGAVLDC